MADAPLQPGATIGILGGGQLGRMLALAAARLGFKTHIFAPEPDSPAFDVVREVTIASYEDTAALALFADSVDVVTYEFENVPASTAAEVAAHAPLYPDARALEVSQDRLSEKTFLKNLGLPVPRFAPIDDRASLAKAVGITGRPAVLKTRRFGYDGKGQAVLREGLSLDAALGMIPAVPAILEAFVPFSREVSVIIARGRTGETAAYAVTENEHRHHILHRSFVPAQIHPATEEKARALAEKIVTALNYVGILAVEMFVVGKGENETLLINEIAPRVHNSGHWTLDGAITSQFEQHIRAIAGWPLGAPAHHGPVEMINLIGDDVNGWPRYAAQPGTTVHLYGKKVIQPGRKMGHVTQIKSQ